VLSHARPLQPARRLRLPTVRDIGLWGPRVQEAFAAMGAIGVAETDAAAMLDNDARVADEFDAKTRLLDVAG